MLLMAPSVPDNCGQPYIVTFSHARHDLLIPFRDKSPGPKQPFSSAFSRVWRPSLVKTADLIPPFFLLTVGGVGLIPADPPNFNDPKSEASSLNLSLWGSSWARFCERIWAQAVDVPVQSRLLFIPFTSREWILSILNTNFSSYSEITNMLVSFVLRNALVVEMFL